MGGGALISKLKSKIFDLLVIAGEFTALMVLKRNTARSTR